MRANQPCLELNGEEFALDWVDAAITGIDPESNKRFLDALPE